MGRRSRWIVGAFVLCLLAPAPALAQDTASTTLNILPSGQYEDASAPGATRQAEMYNALTPLRDQVTDNDLTKDFKSEALDPGTTIVRTETIPGHPGVEIRRDAYGVPHIYGQTDDDVTFGAGYAIAEDRNLLLNQARFDSLTAAIDAPGPSAIDLVKGLYQFTPSKQTEAIVARQTKVLQKAGPKGVQLLHDIDTYVAGINAWYSANQSGSQPWTRNDIYAFNALKGQYLGQGGGKEAFNSQFLTGLQSRFGASKGFDVFKDLKGRDDPTNETTLSKPAPWNPEPSSHKGVVPLKNGSYTPAGPNVNVGTPAAANEASNVLIASGARSSTGHPLFVGGPQISYYFPGLVEEMGLHGPDIDVRGATSAPFPGYMLIGRGESFVWTLTSADGDIVDTYAETLCGGSRLKYEYKGKCLPMQKVDAGTITKGTTKFRDVFYRTVHGSVWGYAKATDGKTVAISRRRSSYGKDTLDQLFFQDLTYGRIRSFADFAKSAAQTPQTFNAVYADATTAGLYTTGLLPIRPNGADSDLVTNGRGKYEWTGYLKPSGHPQGTVPNGLLVNWNNKPAPKFAASDTRFGNETMLPREQMLRKNLNETGVHTLATVTGAMNKTATADVRGYLFWPILKAMLDKGSPPSALAAGAEQQIQSWADAQAPRLDLDRDGNLDYAGNAIMDAAWNRLADAAMCPALSTPLCEQLSTLQARFASPNVNHDEQNYGWFHYMAKDLSTELGRRVPQPYSRRYCGDGSVKKCAAGLWKALDQTAQSLAAQQGPDPSAWRESASPQMIQFSPLPLFQMSYTNRPSGIQQVISFQ
ncbi:MAG TPA: penicillin acylase family protein [Solirubrobacteraceae bacterium]|nr:penicillin acylase family protein [Solirubrobacteraceae bacterium]